MAAPKRVAISSRASLAVLEKSPLTDLQRMFVEHFVKVNGDIKLSVASSNNAFSFDGAKKMLKMPHVLEAIRRYTLMEFQADAVKARATLVEIMDDDESPPMVRRQCAIDILQIASLDLPYVEATKDLGNLDTSNLSEAEKDQLEALLEKMHRDPTTYESDE